MQDVCGDIVLSLQGPLRRNVCRNVSGLITSSSNIYIKIELDIMKPHIKHDKGMKCDLQCNLCGYYGRKIGDNRPDGMTHLYLTGYIYPLTGINYTVIFLMDHVVNWRVTYQADCFTFCFYILELFDIIKTTGNQIVFNVWLWRFGCPFLKLNQITLYCNNQR